MPKRFFQIISLLIISLLFTTNIYGQNFKNLIQTLNTKQIDFHHLTKKDGLSGSNVICVYSDKKGVMWIGTSHGLNRYNGSEIKTFLNAPKDTNSISNNYILSIFQDSKDYLWVGTQNGLNKFDLKTETFTLYQNNQKKSTSITSNFINDVIEDKNGAIWIASKNGLDKFYPNEKTPVFEHYIKGIAIKSLLFDKKNRLWVGSSEGLYLFNTSSNQYVLFQHIENNKNSLSHKSITKVMQDINGNIWIGTNGGGLNKIASNIYNKNSIIFERYQNNTDSIESIPSNRILGITQDLHGNLWLASGTKGLIRLDSKTNKFLSFEQTKGNYNGMINSSLNGIYTGKSGAIWVVGNKGIDIINLQKKPFAKVNTSTNNVYGLTANKIWSIYKDRSNRLWVGSKGKGLSILYQNENDIASKRIINQIQNNSISKSTAISIFEDSYNNLWVGTLNGLYKLIIHKDNSVEILRYNDENISLSADLIWAILEDKYGNLWLGSRKGLNRLRKSQINMSPDKIRFDNFTKRDNDLTSFTGKNVWALTQDKEGNIWVGTAGNGLNKIDAKFLNSDIEKVQFEKYKYQKNDTNSLSNNNINTLKLDGENTLWIGTDGGLNKLDLNSKTKIFKHISTNNGLPDNKICGVLESKKGNLWVSTKKGLSKISYLKNDFAIQNFTTYDGLQGLEFNVQACCKDDEGIMYFAGNNGLNLFSPENIKNNYVVPKIEISKIKIINKEIQLTSKSLLEHEIDDSSEVILLNKQYFLPQIIPYTKQIIINYSDYLLEFEFSALSFLSTKEISYAYKMENFDENWIYIGNRKFATFSNLPAGDYVFRVKTTNADGIWGTEDAHIKIHIKPAWWNTWIFRIILIIAIISGIIVYIKQREKSIIEHRNLLERKVKERTMEVVEQKKSIETKNKELSNLINEVTIQKNNIETQKQLIETIHEEQTSSIRYAKRIQTAVLPSSELLKSILPNYFIFFNPHSLVSGDFYWATKINDNIIITAADCTGHGVPGGFMSMLGISLLNEIVRKKEIKQASHVLNELRTHVIASLNQKGVAMEQRDGMDMALCVINYKLQTVEFSGANNPLYIIRKINDNYNNKYITINNIKYDLTMQCKCRESGIKILQNTNANENISLLEIKADKMPISYYDNMENFTNNIIQLEKEDCIYMFSDGYADQFGGGSYKKFKYKAFKQMLIENSQKSMNEQKEILNSRFNDWKGKQDQVDDVVVLGIKL